MIAWGVARGPVLGAAAASVMSGALIASRPINGVGLGDLSGAQVASLANGVITYVLAGVTVGIVGRTLQRSAEESQRLAAESMRALERAARLAERDRMGRQIHDSVLQALAMVHRRARELATDEPRAAELADMTADQERALRALIMRQPEEPPTGTASLRDALEGVARAIASPPVAVASVGPVWLPAHIASELSAAVGQALQNVASHARASRATVFAEKEGNAVVVTVRDDGRGFVYDEARLAADGKAGIVKSMKGRVVSLGGTMQVRSAPGAGTEVEFRVPVEP